MAIYANGKLNQNNMERVSGGMVKTISATAQRAPLETGDIVILGAFPRESVTIDIRALVHEAFDGTSPAFDLGYYDQISGSFIDIATGIVVDTVDAQIVIPMPNTGNRNPDGTSYTGDRGGIWSGPNEVELAIKWQGGATSPTKGEVSLITTHTYFGTKDGKYGGDFVPLSVY